MMVRVIYKDQTAGVVESHLLDSLIKKGRVVAYHSTDRWVAVDAKVLRTGVAGYQSFNDDLLRYNSH